MKKLALRPLGALIVSVLIATAASANDAPKPGATEVQAAAPTPAPVAATPGSEAPAPVAAAPVAAAPAPAAPAAAAPVVAAPVAAPPPPEPKKPELVLRMGTINMPTQATFKNNLVPLAEAIERDSGGRLKIELGELNKFGRPTELLPKVEKGEIDIASSVQGYHPGRFPRSEVMELPLIFPNAAAGTEAMWKLFEEGLLAEDYKNLKVLSLYVLPPYSVLFADQKVESPRQLRGVSVRAPSRTIGEALDRLGMVPLGLPFNVSGDYVAAGLLEAVNLTWDTAYTTKVGTDSLLVNHVKQGVDLRFAAPALMIVMNKARYDGMPEDLRKILDKHTGRDFTMAMASSRDAANDEARGKFAKEPGKQVYELKPEHRREIAERIEPVIAKWAAEKKAAGIDSQALLSRVRALVAANEKR